MSPAEKKRLAYLDAMGIQVWTARFPGSASAFSAVEPTSPPVEGGAGRAGFGPPNPAEAGPAGGGGDVAAGRAGFSPPSPAEAGPTRIGRGTSGWAETPVPSTLDWETLERKVAACTACPLHQGRTQTVFGVGDRDGDWMVIGEAPGEQEDLRGEPFVGPAGLLLNEMLRAIGLGREKVYIANILKCRPPGNRDPQPDEAAACEAYLKQQMALVKPRIILAVGRIAAQNLLKTATPIGKLRGQVHRYEEIPLVVTYHPAYLLRSPKEKRRAWDDLRLALETYRQSL